jgi:hypothetical protein
MAKKEEIIKRKGNRELAAQHLELAGQLIIEEDEFAEEKDKKLLEDAAFSIEKAEANIEESENN